MIPRLRRASYLLAVAAAFVPAVATDGLGASQAVYQLSAAMDVRQVVPRKPLGNARATGTFSGTLTVSGSRRTLRWRIAYSKLPRVVIADVHWGKPRRFGPILVRLCGPCKPGQSGVKKIGATGARAMINGNTFITLITNRNPNGAIRGQVRVR